MDSKVKNRYLVVLEADKIKKILKLMGEDALIKNTECIELTINLVS